MHACGQKAIQGEITKAVRLRKGEEEPANRGPNNEDKTRNGGLHGLQMETKSKARKIQEYRQFVDNYQRVNNVAVFVCMH